MRSTTIILIILFCGLKISAQNNNENEWENTPKNLTEKCDTLFLRQICDYCNGENSSYNPTKYRETTSCICYSYNEFFVEKINEFLQKQQNEIKIITIENPSNVIFKLNFKNLNKLETLSIFGNDYDCDAIKTLPNELLSLPSLKNLEFNGVRFPKTEIERIKKEFPNLNFVGEISEYDEGWDKTLKNE